MHADPVVLRDVRDELMAHALVRADETNYHTLNVDSVLSACPVLNSTVHEVFRFRGIGTGMVRRVLADQRLGSGYMLKKGGLVFAPNSVQHFGVTRAWDADCDIFGHRRFLQLNGGGLKGTSALRIFGGGGSYCPGRHFASAQLLVFAALVALRADIRPVPGREWANATADKSFGLGIATGFLMPDSDLEVKILSTGKNVVIIK
ncbi:cytochrome P450 [Apiospora aurea]|uniref:Cytochrome P450 n=1 Tax=Apiospora aurea TaxID=335848 RepID=A0ABR1QPM0_9PEZI